MTGDDLGVDDVTDQDVIDGGNVTYVASFRGKPPAYEAEGEGEKAEVVDLDFPSDAQVYIGGMPESWIRQMTSVQLRALKEYEIAALPPEFFKVLTIWQIKALKPRQFKAMSLGQLLVLNGDQWKAIEHETKVELRDQIQDLLWRMN